MSNHWEDSLDKADDDLRIVKLCYMYASLYGIRRAGLPLTRSEKSQLRSLEQLLLGDPQRRRRQHRRIATLIPAVLKTTEGKFRGTVLNLSGGGMFVATDIRIQKGSSIQVEMGRATNKPKYIFPCIVQREENRVGAPGLGLSLATIPTKEDHWESDQLPG